MAPPTPLRSGEVLTPARPQASSDPYAAHLMALIEAADDVSSWSDSLAVAAPAWPDSYHLHPARANVLRTLPLPEQATVLELGARAGALTRHLGETSALVDALELDPAMAAVAAARCADLDTVQIHIGWIDAVPEEPAYDVIIAIDVLDEIHDSGMTLESFLARCRALLRPSGIVVMAVDNSHGLGLILGDRTPKLPFAGNRRATTCTTSELDSAARATGLETVTLSAFPDHRHTQLLFSHERLAEVAPALLGELPKFTHPPLVRPHLDPDAERQRWLATLGDGTAEGVASSIILLAGDTAPVVEDAAAFWSLGRAAAQSACNRIRNEDGAPVVIRDHAFPQAPPVDLPLRLHPHTEPVVQGTPLVRVLAAETSLARARDLLFAWSELVGEAEVDGSSVPWDLIPRNVLVLPDGTMQAVDQEWQRDEADADRVRARGWFWLAADLVQSPTRPWWLIGTTVREAAQHLRRLSGAEPDPFWIETFIRCEADDAACVAPTTTRHSRSFHAHKNRGALMSVSQSGGSQEASASPTDPVDDDSLAALRGVLAAVSDENDLLREHVQSLELDRRHMTLVHRDHVLGLNAELEILRERMASTQMSLRRSKLKATRLQKKVADMRASSTWRIGRMFIAPIARLRGSSSS